MDDPVNAIDTLLENDNLTKPLTIARFALLELVDSPFISTGKEFTVMNIIPSAYIMTHDVKELKGFNSHNI